MQITSRLSILAVDCLLIGLNSAAIVRRGCAADNCLRAFQAPKNIAGAQALCSSLAIAELAVTDIPPFATQACAAATSRISSACACIQTGSSTASGSIAPSTVDSSVCGPTATVTITASPTRVSSIVATTTVYVTNGPPFSVPIISDPIQTFTPTPVSTLSSIATPNPSPNTIIKNGGFESGIYTPWTIGQFGNAFSSLRITDNGYEGNRSFIGTIGKKETYGDHAYGAIQLKQEVSLARGALYSVSFALKVDYDPAMVGTSEVDVALGEPTRRIGQWLYRLNVEDLKSGEWIVYKENFIASMSGSMLQFFSYSNGVFSYQIDDVSIAFVSATKA